MNDGRGFLDRERVFKGPWAAFERAVARLLVHRGWKHVALIGGSGDKGGDIIASSRANEVVYQVKFRSNGGGVGREIVDDVKRAMEYYQIDVGCVVTNGYLTRGALSYLHDLRDTAYKIMVLEGKDLLNSYRSLDVMPASTLEMREYQAQALSALLKAFNRGDRRALLVTATGLGKTFIAGKFLRQIYRKYRSFRTLVVADKEDLIKQFELAIWSHLPKYVSTHLWYGQEKPSYDDGVTLATFQSLNSRVRSGEELGHYNLAIIDECHHAGAETYDRIIEGLNPDFILGMTATPFRGDERDIRDIFGPPVFQMDIIEGMRNGYLSRVDYRVFSDNIDWEMVHSNSQNSFTVKDLNKRLFLPQRDEEILSIVRKVWLEESINRAIFFTASIEHCKKMALELISYGFKARALYSGMDPRLRERHLREFRQGHVQVLLAVDILNEGIDIPEVDLVVFLRVTHSRIIFLQQLGRGLRLSEGKSKVIVLDFVADVKRVASVMNLSRRDQSLASDDVEVLRLPRFEVDFVDATSQSFFEALIQDRLEIEDFDDAELFLP